MSEEKKCKYCAMMIPKEAKICPHCRKKQGTSFFVGFLAVIFGLIIISMMINALSEHKPIGQRSSVSVGKEGIINGGGEETLLTVSESAFDEWIKAKAANDEYAMGAMFMNGKAFTVKSGTKALVIDQSMFKRRVRILEGKYKGISGWTAMEHVK
jgi:RNA polymerase subunit RPABC4/transcription elongation factor Spt4